MTCSNGMTEGLGRVLAVRTKQEAADVTVAILQPEHIATLPVAPAKASEKRDLTISDIFRAEDLGVEEPENLPSEAANDTVSHVLPIAETRQLAVCCGGSGQNQSVPEATPALKARPVSTVKRSDFMKWRTFVVALFSVAIGCLYGINSRTSEKVDVLMDYYLAHEFGPEAMNGKIYVEVTPQVENTGINRFIPVVCRLPYTDAATLERLFNEEDWVVTKIWGDGANTVVQMSNWYYAFLGCLDKDMARLSNENRPYRSVLIHPHPASVSVYKSMAENGWNGRIYDRSFAKREHYDVASESAMRVVAYAGAMPAITHEELAKLGNMNLIWDYGNGVLFLTEPYGASERFVRLTDADYYSMQTSSQFMMSYDAVYPLKEVSFVWWSQVLHSAIKEEQTAVK